MASRRGYDDGMAMAYRQIAWCDLVCCAVEAWHGAEHYTVHCSIWRDNKYVSDSFQTYYLLLLFHINLNIIENILYEYEPLTIYIYRYFILNFRRNNYNNNNDMFLFHYLIES